MLLTGKRRILIDPPFALVKPNNQDTQEYSLEDNIHKDRGREERTRPKPEEKPAKQRQPHPGAQESQKREIEDSEKKALVVRKLKILAVTLHHWWPSNKNRD